MLKEVGFPGLLFAFTTHPFYFTPNTCRDASTTMPLTPEEITQAKDAAATGIIPEFLKPLADNDWVLRSTKQEDEFKTNYKTQVITARDGELYTQFDTVIEEATGVKKNSGEKNTDYAKRAFGSVSQELTDLRAAKADGSLSKLEKERLTQLEDALKGKDTDIANLKTTHTQELLGLRVGADISGGLAGIRQRIKAAYKEGDVFSDIEAARLAKFKNDYKPEEVKDGDNVRIVYRDSKGDIVNNPTTYKPATATELLEKVFEPYIEKGGQGGGGSGPQGGPAPTTPPGKVTKETYAPPADLKSRTQLVSDLKAKGFAMGGADFNELMTKYGKDANGNDLPLGRE
jgi:hypothetical protein